LLCAEKLNELNLEKTFYTIENFYIKLKNIAEAKDLTNCIRFLLTFLSIKPAKTIYNVRQSDFNLCTY